MNEQSKSSGSVKVPVSEPLRLVELVDYQEGSVVSREILKNENGTITAFAFDQGQGLSEHTAPFDAVVQILEGEADVTIGSRKLTISSGETVIMPANVPHVLQAHERFKMVLVMIRG